MDRTRRNHIVVHRHALVARTATAGCLGGLVLVAACGSSSNGGTPMDSGTGTTMDSSSGTTTDSSSGTTMDGAPEAGQTSTTPLGLGFYPSNIACALTTAALESSLDAGLDTSMLGDVDVSDDISIPSDSDFSGTLETLESVQGNVAYTTIRQSNGVKVGIYIAKSWTVETGITMTITGAYPIALVALTNIAVYGNIVVTGAGGYNDNASTEESQGAGPGGGAAGVSGTSGAGGGSYCGTGGPGGASTATTPAYGTAAIVPLVGGSAGGNAATSDGGAGGGAIQLVAGTAVTVSGTVSAGGAGGGFGADGGGSGGAILVEAPTVSVTGTLAANGGSGASGGDASAGVGGLASTMAAQGGAGGSDDATGGNGSAGTMIDGAPGGTQNDGYAGGGGGAGYIRINTTAGTATISAPLSPDVTTTCVSQGKVAAAATCS